MSYTLFMSLIALVCQLISGPAIQHLNYDKIGKEESLNVAFAHRA